ncbi:MAG TPA: response regulator [Candidatus Binatia bacterium]
MSDKKKILLVEDHADIRRLLAFFLEGAGYDVVEADMGLAAIERANTTHPDLITMDLGLPDMTGAEAITRIKADPSTKHIPVIVITAYYSGSPLVESALAAGACEILHKPVALRILEETVQRLLTITPNEASEWQTI